MQIRNALSEQKPESVLVTVADFDGVLYRWIFKHTVQLTFMFVSNQDIQSQRRQDQSKCEHQPEVLQGAAGAWGRRRPQEGIWGLACRCGRR